MTKLEYTKNCRSYENEAALDLLINNNMIPEFRLRVLETIIMDKQTCKPSLVYYINKSWNFISKDIKNISSEKLISLLNLDPRYKNEV